MPRLLACLSLLFFLLPAPAQAAEPIVGTILEVEGNATVSANGKSVKAAIKTPVRMKDLVTTGPKARVFILFIDETEMTLSEKTKLRVDEYVFNPNNDKNDKARYSVLEGAFKYVSGLIGKKSEPDISINTNYGSLGIRGTVLWGGRLKDSYGVHVKEGRVRVKNDAGAVDVAKGQGTMVKDRKSRPTNAAPFPEEAMQFIQSTVFLAGQAALLKRITGFRGENLKLRDQFTDFLKKGGLPGGVIPDGILPGDNKKGRKNGNKKPSIPGLPGGLPF